MDNPPTVPPHLIDCDVHATVPRVECSSPTCGSTEGQFLVIEI